MEPKIVNHKNLVEEQHKEETKPSEQLQAGAEIPDEKQRKKVSGTPEQLTAEAGKTDEEKRKEPKTPAQLKAEAEKSDKETSKEDSKTPALLETEAENPDEEQSKESKTPEQLEAEAFVKEEKERVQKMEERLLGKLFDDKSIEKQNSLDLLLQEVLNTPAPEETIYVSKEDQNASKGSASMAIDDDKDSRELKIIDGHDENNPDYKVLEKDTIF